MTGATELPLSRGVCVDVETTGTIPAADRVVAIALQDVRLFLATAELKPVGEPRAVLVDPGVTIPAEATAVHGITDADVSGKPTFAKRARHVAKVLFDTGFIVGYNVRFDLEVLDNELSRAGILDYIREGIASKPRLDGLRLWQTVAPRSLSDACREFGVEPGKAHDAASDAAAATGVVASLLKRMDPADFLALLDPSAAEGPADYIGERGFLRRRGSDTVFAAGKHAGAVLATVDAGYLRWMVSKGDFDSAVNDAVSAELARRGA